MTALIMAAGALIIAAFIAMCAGHERAGTGFTLAALAAFIACAAGMLIR